MKWDIFEDWRYASPRLNTKGLLENAINIAVRNCRIGNVCVKEKLP